MLELYDCLNQEECKQILEGIYSLKELWTPRMGAGFPFYTLGTASYLDAAEKGQIYYKMQAAKTNPLLQKHFSRLYELTAAALKKATGCDVQYEEQFALPGFHIFQYSKFFQYPVASCHFDLQFKEFFWKHRNIDYDHPYSFTLALKLPAKGGGLNYWDIYYPDVKDLSRQDLEALRDDSEQHFIAYQTGKMIVHNGLMLHQIAPTKDIKKEDERITLQGHGIICDGVLHVYW